MFKLFATCKKFFVWPPPTVMVVCITLILSISERQIVVTVRVRCGAVWCPPGPLMRSVCCLVYSLPTFSLCLLVCMIDLRLWFRLGRLGQDVVGDLAAQQAGRQARLI